MRLKLFVVLLISCLFIPTITHSITYKWVDENGVSHVSNTPPKGYQIIDPEEQNRNMEDGSRAEMRSAWEKWRKLMRYKSYDLAHLNREEFQQHILDVQETVEIISTSPSTSLDNKQELLRQAEDHLFMLRTEMNRRRNGEPGR